MDLPKVAFGTWSWGVGGFAGGDQVFGNHLEADALKPVFEAGTQAGPSLWDTATVYGLGASESILGAFVQTQPRNRVLVSTKFTPQIAPALEKPVEAMLEASLKRFGTDYIDLYWIHNPQDVRKWTPGLIPLLKDGRVKHVGVSNHNLSELKLAQSILAREGFSISAVQNHYSLLYRSSEEAGILDYCRKQGIAFFAYMVLEQGALSGKYGPSHPLPEGSGRADTYNKLLPQLQTLTQAMAEVGSSHGASVAQVALAWAVAKRTVPLVGVTKTSHVDDALRAAQISLTTEEVVRLETLAAQTGVDTRGGWEHSMV